MSEPLLIVEGLKKHFPIQTGLLRRTAGQIRSVDGVSFTVRRGETLGIVGESGSGKSTLARTLLRLIEPTAGQITFKGQRLDQLEGEALRKARRHMQMVFQDPYWSLNPRLRVQDVVMEPLRAHGGMSRAAMLKRVAEVCELVGLPRGFLTRYPHELSGGQRQRVGVARALALNPDLVVLDEPTSALDVSVQAQVLNLLADLKEQLGLTYILISHDIGVVNHLSDTVAVMYAGRIAEMGPADQVLNRPQHPYTRALIAAVPEPDPRLRAAMEPLQGDVPDPARLPGGCRFHPRCPLAEDRCKGQEPELHAAGAGQWVACHLLPEADAAEGA